MKDFLSLLLAVSVAGLQAAASAAKPNVIIVLTDDQGYGDLSGTGNPILKTPHMDQLAAEGVRFSNFHVDSYCSPTRSALMTGRYSHRVGGWGTVNGRNMLRDEEATMADVFRHNDYRTGIFGKWHLGSNYPYRPMDRGFDEWLGQGDGGTGCTTDYWGNDRVNDHYLYNGQWERQPRPGFQCEVFFDAAMQFMRENKQRPFFTYLAAYNPHSPCSVPDKQWLAPYRGKVAAPVAHLFASVARIDENLGRLRKFLVDEGLADNTVLIFLTDNGTGTGSSVFNAGMRGHKGEPYEGGHRVPCFLRWPAGGFDKSVAVDRLATHLDLLPTLVDLCALKLPKPIAFDGASLKPLLADPQSPWPERTLVMGSPRNETGANPPPPRFGQGCAVMTDRWRLVNDRELYDLTKDPGQKRDVAGEFPKVVTELKRAYQSYWDSVSTQDSGWRGRPIIGSPHSADTELCAEDWDSTKGNCPWNQGAVAAGNAVFGRWPVRFGATGSYEIEVRRWPREADAPLAGVPAGKATVDAQLPAGPVTNLLYNGVPKALPVASVRLQVGTAVQETAATATDRFVAFTTQVAAGPTDITATLLDASGKELCGAFYVSVRKTAAQSGLEKTPIDWPSFMRQHDMTFDKLPSDWTEAPHFGNAMVGSMLYQSDDTIRLQVFRADVHDHRDNTWGWTAYSRPRFEIGYFSLHPVGKLTGCKWRKDLWNSELTGTITTDRGEIRIRHFTHAEDMALVTELTPTAGEQGCNWTWHPAEARTTRPGYPTKESQIAGFAKAYGSHYADTLQLWQPNPAGRLEQADGTSVWVQDLLAGGQYATAWSEQVRGDTRTLIASIANSYPEATAAKTAVTDVKRFLGVNRSAWVQLHRAWWHDYYPRSFVTLPDQSLESLYWQTIYRFGCTSRTGRCFVDTPGIWFQGKSWPYFTTDWNIQSAHWPVYTANRLEQGQSLIDRLHERQDELIKAVRPSEWQVDSAYLPLAVAWDLIGTREDDRRYYDLVGNLPWALHNGWSQYRYSMDDAMLRERFYPLLRRAINLYLHMVKEEKDGTFRLPPTYSPESGVFADCNFDLALFKWGCHTLLKAAKRLQIDDPLIPRWKAVIEHLPDYPADEHGFMLGRGKSSLANHQHFSNLLMIYPLHLVNIEQAGTADVLKRSFDRARSTAGPGQRQAMVQAHAGPMGTAMGLAEEALDSLKRLQGDLYPNGLWYESPCIESTLAAATIIQDMFLQSWSDPAQEDAGPLRIFPAVPAAWQDVEFHDLRAEGAFLVSAKRSGGRTKWVRIKSLAGEPCRVRPGMIGEIRIKGDREHPLRLVTPGVYEIDLKKGEEVLLSVQGS